MNLQQFYYFKTIAEEGSYTRAAKRLFLTQSSLSHSIADLERELGVPLFRKEGRDIMTTEYGEVFLVHVNKIINDLDVAMRDIQALQDATAGKVRIFCSHVLTMHYFPQIIQNFYEQQGNQRIRFDISEDLARPTIEALLKGEIDLGFSAKIDNDELEFFPIIEEELLLVTPLEHPLAGRDNVRLAELAGLPLITYSYDCGTRYYVDHVFEEAGVTPNVVQLVDNERMMASMVATGLGVGIMPRIKELLFFDVSVQRLENSSLHRPLYMIWPKNQYLRPVAKTFRDYVIRNTNI